MPPLKQSRKNGFEKAVWRDVPSQSEFGKFDDFELPLQRGIRNREAGKEGNTGIDCIMTTTERVKSRREPRFSFG